MGIISFDHPWVFTFGILGNIISFMVYLAPVITFYRVCKKKSTQGFHSVPYMMALFSSMLWLYYAILRNKAVLLITINSFGCVVEIVYIIIFIIYAPKEARRLTLKLFGFMNFGLFSLIFLVTQFSIKAVYQVQVLGWICVVISVCVFAAPLSILAQVIRTKSVEFLPFTLSFFLTLSAVMWFAYGLLLKDICIALPNVLGFVLGLLQMLLYAIYKNKEKNIKEKEKLPEQGKDVGINLSTIATCDPVHPVVVDPRVEQDIEKNHELDVRDGKVIIEKKQIIEDQKKRMDIILGDNAV